MSRWKHVRTVGYVTLLFFVDVLANVAAEALSIFTRWGSSVSQSQAPREVEEPVTAVPASTAGGGTRGLEIAVVVLVVTGLLCTLGACLGAWFRVDIIEALQRTRGGFRVVADYVDDEDDSSMVSIELEQSDV